MDAYALEFDEGWDAYFKRLDKGMRGRVWKKVQQLKQAPASRHLKQGPDFFIAEIGQYRIAYRVFEPRKVKRIYFVGDHKEYEKWLGM